MWLLIFFYKLNKLHFILIKIELFYCLIDVSLIQNKRQLELLPFDLKKQLKTETNKKLLCWEINDFKKLKIKTMISLLKLNVTIKCNQIIKEI